MPDYQTAARVLIEANTRPVDLSKHCDIYSQDGRDLIAFLERHAVVEKIGLGVPAASKLGAFISSPLGDRVEAQRITVKHTDKSRQLAANKSENEVVAALKQLPDGR